MGRLRRSIHDATGPVALMTDRTGGELNEVLDHMDEAGQGEDSVTIGAVLQSIGQQSFGPCILVPALIVMSPLGGIPGVPTTAALIVVLFAGQLLLGRGCCWLPRFLADRSVRRSRFEKALSWLRPVARWTDKVVGERLAFLATGPFVYAIAVVCILVALAMPVLEVVPFANTATAAALCAFGLAIVAKDGLLTILGFLLTGIGIVIGVTAWPS
jgi:hypothetical protein